MSLKTSYVKRSIWILIKTAFCQWFLHRFQSNSFNIKIDEQHDMTRKFCKLTQISSSIYPIIITIKVHEMKDTTLNGKKMHNESAQSPRQQYFNSLSAATKTCLSGFLLNIDRPREKVFFFPLCKKKVIVAMLKIICYQCRLIVASRLEFLASIRCSSLHVAIENSQIESDQVSQD